jgi:hypothetical protein
MKELDSFTGALFGRKPTQQEQQLSRFRIVNHCKIKLEYLFNNDQLQRQVNENQTTDYQVRTIVHTECGGKLQIGFPTGSQNDVMSMSNDCVTHNEIGNLFIQLGGKHPLALRRTATDTSGILIDDIAATKTSGILIDDNELMEEIDEQEDERIGYEENNIANLYSATEISSASYGEALDCAMLLNYAGALRWMQHSVTHQPDQTNSSVKPLDVWRLPIGMCNHPHPMTSRLLDVNILFLLQIAHDSGIFEKTKTNQKGERVCYTPELDNDLIHLLFQATMLRFTGRVKHFRTYARLTHRIQMVPLPNQVNDFLAFMKQTLKGNTDSKQMIGQWISSQHKNCIPVKVMSFLNFSSFATGLAEKLPNIVNQMVNSETHGEAVGILRDLLQQLTQQDNVTNIYWMSQQIVADVVEIFDGAFGEPDIGSVQLGFGARVGMLLIQKGKDHSMSQTPATILTHIVNQIHSVELPIQHLRIMGLERKQKEGKDWAVHKMNGRRFNVTDAEEVLCRIYSAAKVTFGAYSNSENPRFGKPYCHPMRMNQYDKTNLVLDQTTKEIMEDIVDAMDEVDIRIPEFCFRPGERSWREKKTK